MTKVSTISDEIYECEGFRVVVQTAKGRVVNVNKNGVLRSYPRKRATLGRFNVKRYVKEGFERYYPGWTCKVLDGDGNIVDPKTHLKTVRSSY